MNKCVYLHCTRIGTVELTDNEYICEACRKIVIEQFNKGLNKINAKYKIEQEDNASDRQQKN